ncbi:hypothetical protein Anapl_13408 [Anas platyrhynchos]|uniref:Uncharacterized protein n=1 Tax=Anas platyrhynchos TaxID=8839 RepID=R0L4H9_ANAPL|nr:hypothetical protein Anapl_13408 [Anas platyrhynchos]
MPSGGSGKEVFGNPSTLAKSGRLEPFFFVPGNPFNKENPPSTSLDDDNKRLSFFVIHHHSTPLTSDLKKLELIQEDQPLCRLQLQTISRPNSWTDINLALSLQGKVQQVKALIHSLMNTVWITEQELRLQQDKWLDEGGTDVIIALDDGKIDRAKTVHLLWWQQLTSPPVHTHKLVINPCILPGLVSAERL